MPFGPSWWQIPANRLKKCSEFRSDSCDPVETDGCCAVIPCTYCLDWQGAYADKGEANWTGSGWTGVVNTWSVRMYWERNYQTAECEFVVTVDGVEVYRNDCYGGQSCRDSSDSVTAEIDGQAGTLTWTKLEPRPLEYVDDPDAPGCKTWFCGDCECTCERLCVVVTEVLAELGPCYGEAVDASYQCSGPNWIGTVSCNYNSYDVDLALERDAYGNCVLRGSVNGEDIAERSITDCGAINETWTLYDGTTVQVFCKRCDCDSGRTGCCPNLPEVLYLTVDALYESGVIACVLIEDGETAIWQALPYTVGPDGEYTTITNCNTLPPFNQSQGPRGIWATVTCTADGLVVAMGTGVNVTDLFAATFAGCYGGTLCSTDPEVTRFEFGGSCLGSPVVVPPSGCVTLSA